MSLGQKFSVNNSLNNKYAIETIKNIEFLLNKNDFDEEVKNYIRFNIISNINIHLNSKKHVSVLDRNFQEYINFTKKYLYNHNHEIFFTNSDKGNATVALQNHEYVSKMELLLSDTSTYTQLISDPTVNLRKDHEFVYKTYY